MHVKQAYNTVLRIVNEPYAAEDVVQEGFVKAFKHIKKFKGEAQFSTWLMRIMINTALNKLQLKKQEWLSITADEEKLPDPISLNDSLEEGSLTLAVINKHIADLPKGCRVVFTLYLIEGYDQVEIAEILDISISTVKSQYQRARRLLQQSLTEEKNGK